jgi:hypothetical protein
MNLIANGRPRDGVAKGVSDRKWRAAFERINDRLAVDQPLIVRGIMIFEDDGPFAEKRPKRARLRRTVSSMQSRAGRSQHIHNAANSFLNVLMGSRRDSACTDPPTAEATIKRMPVTHNRA